LPHLPHAAAGKPRRQWLGYRHAGLPHERCILAPVPPACRSGIGW